MPRNHGLAGLALVLALDKGAEAFTVFPGSSGHNTGSNVIKTSRPRYVKPLRRMRTRSLWVVPLLSVALRTRTIGRELVYLLAPHVLSLTDQGYGEGRCCEISEIVALRVGS